MIQGRIKEDITFKRFNTQVLFNHEVHSNSLKPTQIRYALTYISIVPNMQE